MATYKKVDKAQKPVSSEVLIKPANSKTQMANHVFVTTHEPLMNCFVNLVHKLTHKSSLVRELAHEAHKISSQRFVNLVETFCKVP